eukprot:4213674-Amphidinium_carterae.1
MTDGTRLPLVKKKTVWLNAEESLQLFPFQTRQKDTPLPEETLMEEIQGEGHPDPIQSPTIDEMQKHSCTHPSRRPWCVHCVKGAGVDDRHWRKRFDQNCLVANGVCLADEG